MRWEISLLSSAVPQLNLLLLQENDNYGCCDDDDDNEDDGFGGCVGRPPLLFCTQHFAAVWLTMWHTLSSSVFCSRWWLVGFCLFLFLSFSFSFCR